MQSCRLGYCEGGKSHAHGREGGGCRQWDHFLFSLEHFRGRVLGILNFHCEGLSQPNLQAVGFATTLSHPASDLLRSDWLRDTEDWERERERGTEKTERQHYSFSLRIHTETNREERRMLPLNLLLSFAPAPRSVLNQQNYPRFLPFRNYWAPLWTVPHASHTGGVGNVCLWECFDRIWPKRSVVIRSRSPYFIPSVRCLQWRPNMPPCCLQSVRWRVFQTAWMSWVMKSCPVLGQPPNSSQHTPLLSWWVAKPFLGLIQNHSRETHVHAAWLFCVCFASALFC